MTRLHLACYAALGLCLFLMWRTSEGWKGAARGWEEASGKWEKIATESAAEVGRWRGLTEKAVKQLDACDAETELWRRDELKRKADAEKPRPLLILRLAEESDIGRWRFQVTPAGLALVLREDKAQSDPCFLTDMFSAEGKRCLRSDP